jgi:hypothetical protein
MKRPAKRPDRFEAWQRRIDAEQTFIDKVERTLRRRQKRLDARQARLYKARGVRPATGKPDFFLVTAITRRALELFGGNTFPRIIDPQWGDEFDGPIGDTAPNG